jgi:hypothetical protein
MRVLAGRLSVVVAGMLLAGCYHAIIDTGRPASSEVIEQPRSNTFVYGLVPPPVVETMAKCPSGVSKVETQHSFLNSLVGALTFGIYTPIDIRVTCAGGGSSIGPSDQLLDVGPDAAASTQQAAVQHAATLAVESGEAVFVKM